MWIIFTNSQQTIIMKQQDDFNKSKVTHRFYTKSVLLLFIFCHQLSLIRIFEFIFLKINYFYIIFIFLYCFFLYITNYSLITCLLRINFADLIIQYYKNICKAFLLSDKKINMDSRDTSISISSQNQETEVVTDFDKILQNNRKWAKQCIRNEPDYFTKLVHLQKPKYLWLGCADSRVPANQIMGLKPGEVFVHRNIANVMPPSDINVLAVVQYAVEHLGVEVIIVGGHYGCGGISAAFQQNDYGPLQSWLSHIRQIRKRYRDALIGSQSKKERTLVQLNIKQQVINVARFSVVQKAWSKNKKLAIHGVVYKLEDGILQDLGVSMSDLSQLPQQYKITSALSPQKK